MAKGSAFQFTAAFGVGPAGLPRPANVTLRRVVPAERKVRGRIAVRWTVALGGRLVEPARRPA